MDKRDLLGRLAANGDERLLLGRVWDKYEQCRRRNIPVVTGFLSPAEQELVRRLKSHGYCVYYLSNIPQDVLDLLRDRGVLDGFDGGVASCEVHINKPDPKIYKALLDKYSLKAEECVFIDDRLENVQAAFRLGFAGIQMKDSVGTLVRSLATCNVTLR